MTALDRGPDPQESTEQPIPANDVTGVDQPRRFLGRRSFVTGTLLGGSAAAVGYAIAVATEPGTASQSPGAIPAGAVVLAGRGVDPTGAEDSTSGLQALFDAAPEGAWLWLPAGTYRVEGLTLHARQMLSGPSARSYLGSACGGAQVVARVADSTAPVLVVSEFGRVTDVAVSGRDRRQPAIRPAGVGVVLERVTMTAASVGFDAAYVSGSMLVECLVHENGIGIKDPVDSMVQACVINANADAGISLGPGANDNSFVGNKVEWNDGEGVIAYRALHNSVIGGVIDRNGRAGVRMVECEHSCLVGAVLRRNGRLAEGSPDDDCHVDQQDCTGIAVTGVVTNAGADDDDSGYRSPAVAVRTSGGTAVGFTGNDLSGRTSDVAIARVDSAGGPVGLNVGVGGVQLLSGTRARVMSGDLRLSPGDIGELTADLGAVVTGGPGQAYRLDLVSQDEVTGAAGLAQALVLVSRGDDPARADLGPVEDRIGTVFGGPDPALRLTVDVAVDGAALTVRIQNAGDAGVRLGVELA